MEKTVAKKKLDLPREAAWILLTVVGGVLIPQILHGLGILLGIGGSLGQMLLPMYLPVMILGFYRGPLAGAIAGVLAPQVSFLVSGMPARGVLAFITLELVMIGAFSGIFAKAKMPSVLQVLAAQGAAKVVRLSAFAVSAWIVSGSFPTASALFAGVALSIPGYLLQIAVMTYLLSRKDRDAHEAD